MPQEIPETKIVFIGTGFNGEHPVSVYGVKCSSASCPRFVETGTDHEALRSAAASHTEQHRAG